MRTLAGALLLCFATLAAQAQGVNDRLPTGAPQYPTYPQQSQPSSPTVTPNRAMDYGQRRMYEPRPPRAPVYRRTIVR